MGKFKPENKATTARISKNSLTRVMNTYGQNGESFDDVLIKMCDLLDIYLDKHSVKVFDSE